MSPTQPQASSTLRSEYNLLGRSPVLQVAKLQHQSKPPKKIVRIARSKSVKTGAQASEEASKVNKSKSAKTRAQAKSTISTFVPDEVAGPSSGPSSAKTRSQAAKKAPKKAPKCTTTRIRENAKEISTFVSDEAAGPSSGPSSGHVHDNYCAYCGERISAIDLKSKNMLISCSGHQVHKYCKQDCIAGHD